jgi:DNA-binding NarL/FixJ family response regulator
MPTLRTFIVEDNLVILSSLIETLEEIADIQVVGAVGNEQDAVSELQARAGEVDLVIVDLFLHSGSGLGVLRSAQALNLPARRVVLSNYATPAMRRHCADMGADQVFDKSSELDELIAYCEALADA